MIYRFRGNMKITGVHITPVIEGQEPPRFRRDGTVSEKRCGTCRHVEERKDSLLPGRHWMCRDRYRHPESTTPDAWTAICAVRDSCPQWEGKRT